MNLKRREKIKADHPLLFSYHPSIYFECLDGWLDIIEDLANKLEPLIESFIKENPEDSLEQYPSCVQVKEKFGGLRFYMTMQSQEMRKLVDEATLHASETCENCGKKGKLRNKNWLYIRCDECWAKGDE